MGVMQKLVGGQRSMGDNGTAWGSWGDSGGDTWAGPSVGYGNAAQLLAVYGSVRFIADGIATLPVEVLTGSGDAARPVTPPAWVEQPTVDLDRVEWMTQIIYSLLLSGNAYLRIVRRDASISELVPLDPQRVTVTRENAQKTYRINGHRVDPFTIKHIKGIMVPGADVGLSPVEAARQNIGLGLAAAEFGARFFDQNGTVGGVIETPGGMDPKESRTMAREWARFHSGRKRAHLPGVLTGGATWKPTGVTNDQAQFLQTRQFTAAEIHSEMFLIDPTEFGVSGDKGSSITYANLEQRNARKATVTYLPWIIRIERAVASLLGPNTYFKINVSGLLRGDLKTRYESYKVGLNEDFLLPEEVRSWEDLPPLPDRPAAPPSLVDQIDAVGALIRAGFVPSAALEALGLPEIAHTGLVPVTVKEETV